MTKDVKKVSVQPLGDRVLVSGVSSAPVVDETGVIASFAAVNSGYLPTVTVSLAIGAQRMANHRVLVRHLEAEHVVATRVAATTD